MHFWTLPYWLLSCPYQTSRFKYEYQYNLPDVLGRVNINDFLWLWWPRRVIGISGSLIWSKTLKELIFNPCGEFRWCPEGPVSQIHSPRLYSGAPGIFSDLLRSVQILQVQWSAESNGKLPHLFIPSKTATKVPEFAVEDLLLGRIAALVPEFAVKHLPLGTTLWWWWWWWWWWANISGDGWGLFVGKTPEKTTSKTGQSGIEPGPSRSEATILSLDNSGGSRFKIANYVTWIQCM